MLTVRYLHVQTNMEVNPNKTGASEMIALISSITLCSHGSERANEHFLILTTCGADLTTWGIFLSMCKAGDSRACNDAKMFINK